METTELKLYNKIIGPYRVFMEKTNQGNYCVGAIRVGSKIPVINSKYKNFAAADKEYNELAKDLKAIHAPKVGLVDKVLGFLTKGTIGPALILLLTIAVMGTLVIVLLFGLCST